MNQTKVIWESLEQRRLLSAASLVDGILTVSLDADAGDVSIVRNVVLYDANNPDQPQSLLGIEITGGQTFIESQAGEIKEVRVFDGGQSHNVNVAPNAQVPVNHTSTPPATGQSGGMIVVMTPDGAGSPNEQLFVGISPTHAPAK